MGTVLKPITCDVKELLGAIPDEDYYHITEEVYCKYGNEVVDQDDYRFQELKVRANNYKSEVATLCHMHKVAYYWYKKYPSQKNYINIPGMYSALNVENDYDAKTLLFQFGLLDMNVTGGGTAARTYLVPVEGETKEDLELNFFNYVNDYLPENASNIQLVLQRNYDLLELDSIKQLLKACEPPLNQCQIFNEDLDNIKQKNINDYIDSEKESYKQFGIKKFIDVTDILSTVENDWSDANINTFNLFQDAVNEVLNQASEVGNPNQVMIYTYRINYFYMYFAAYMKYFHKIACIDADIKYAYLNTLSDLMYSPDCMLAADRLLYLRNFPTYTVKTTDFGMNIFLTINRTLKCSVTMVEIDDDLNLGDEVIVDLLDAMNLSNELINITTLFNFDKGNEETIQANDELRRLFMAFYNKILKSESTIKDYPTPCNTLIINTGKSKYLARVDSISEINMEGYVTNLELQSSKLHSIDKHNDLFGWIPLDFFNDADLGRKVMYNVLKNAKILDKITLSEEVRPRYTVTKEAFYYRYLFENKLRKRSSFRIPNTFVVANLNAPVSVLSRRSQVWGKVFNNNPNLLSQLTCFYCTDATILSEIRLDIDETMLAESYLDGGLYE